MHNPTVVHKAKKLSETELEDMGQRMNGWATKHEDSLRARNFCSRLVVVHNFCSRLLACTQHLLSPRLASSCLFSCLL